MDKLTALERTIIDLNTRITELEKENRILKHQVDNYLRRLTAMFLEGKHGPNS
jgi:hypothetical protein